MLYLRRHHGWKRARRPSWSPEATTRPDYNGFKMMLGRKPVLRPSRSAELGDMAAAGSTWLPRKPAAPTASSRCDVTADYVARLASDWDGGDAAAQGRVGQRQRGGWRSAATARGPPACRASTRCSTPHHRRHAFPPHHPDPTVAEATSSPDHRRRSHEHGRRHRHRVRWRRRPHRRGGRQGGNILFGDQLLVILGARHPPRHIPVRPSSPTSRRARCCSTKSPARAAWR